VLDTHRHEAYAPGAKQLVERNAAAGATLGVALAAVAWAHEKQPLLD
jgi:hypothetical protein